jgi:hypothetical protein
MNNRNRRILGVLGIIFIVLAILLATYSLVFYTAWQRAEEERIEDERRALLYELEKQISLARKDINDGNFELGLRRLDWIIDLRPDYSGATELRDVARSSLSQSLTPEATATSRPPPTPSSSMNDDLDPASLFAELERLYQGEQWLSAATEVAAFQVRFPNFRRRDTDKMLFNASINLGLELMQGDQIELGLFYISQAEELGDLPQEVDDYRTWAELYLLGIGYFGVDWGQAIYYFRGLCSAAPYYQDSCTRLYESLIAYGDIYSASMEWCPAEELYFEAMLFDMNAALSQKHEEARTTCLEATPTPTVVVTSVVVITSTPTITPE